MIFNHHVSYDVRENPFVRYSISVGTSTVSLEKYSADLDLRSYNIYKILKLCKKILISKNMIIKFNFNLIINKFEN